MCVTKDEPGEEALKVKRWLLHKTSTSCLSLHSWFGFQLRTKTDGKEEREEEKKKYAIDGR